MLNGIDMKDSPLRFFCSKSPETVFCQCVRPVWDELLQLINERQAKGVCDGLIRYYRPYTPICVVYMSENYTLHEFS